MTLFKGDYADTIELIVEHDIEINSTYGSKGLTALQKAMFSGDTSRVEFLRRLRSHDPSHCQGFRGSKTRTEFKGTIWLDVSLFSVKHQVC